MRVSVYNWDGKETGVVELNDAVFGHAWNASLVRQALIAQEANRRQVVAHTKTRAEVSGGGKKPWKQKHTGRARHGSIRSPLWKGGGVTHGPRKDRVFSKKINKKMKRLALHVVLSKKLKDQELTVIDSFSLDAVKTGALAKKLKGTTSALLVAATKNRALGRASRNLARVASIPSHALSVEAVLRARRIMIEEPALQEIK